MRGDPGGSPGRWGYWEYGVPCGYMSGDLLLTSQVPQGNLETMMRILINSAGALCAYTSGGDRLLRMATLLFGSRSRAEWCWGPSARAVVLVLALGHLRMTEALLFVATTSTARTSTGLPRVAKVYGGDQGSSRSIKLVVVDTYENGDVNGPPYTGGELAPLDPLPSFVRALVPRVPGPMFKSTGRAYSEDLGGVLSSASGAANRDACTFPIAKPLGPWPGPRPIDHVDPISNLLIMVQNAVSDRPIVTSMRMALTFGIFVTPLPLNVKMLLFLLDNLVTIEAVCPHCKDTILPAGHTATACPLIIELTKNANIFTQKTLGSSPTVAYSMTHELAMQFTRPVVDAIVGLACAPVQGVQIDFTDATYSQANAVVKAAIYGHCSFSEATAILAERLDGAADQLAVDKIRGAMESLKTAGESAVNSATGTLLFIWSKVSNVLPKRTDFTFKLDAGKSKATSLSVTLVRPANESEFFEVTHLFIMTIVALGVASYTIVGKFVDDVIFGTTRMKESFKVAHELVLLYFREIDMDPARALHMGNVFRRGGQDTLLSEARRNAAAFFRAGGGILQPNGTIADKVGDIKFNKDLKPNGKSDESSKKPCPDFNAGRPCKKLKPDGTCSFAHKCNQFVSDKGPNGYCFGSHARCVGCDYDAAKKLRAPAA